MDMSPTYQESITQPPPADWTIMLYIEADGALANFAVESLKQLHESASAPSAQKDNEANVVVAAHFSFSGDATKPEPGNEIIGEYIFRKDDSEKKDGGECPNFSRVRALPAPEKLSKKDNLLLSDALKEFLKGVYGNEKCNAKHYALILWGHGPELLFESGAGTPTHSGFTTYITPVQLRGVLSTEKPPDGSSLDIVGFDACFMSMLEMACELEGFARFMVASQDEVPDASFPYDNLVKLFRQHGREMALLIEECAKAEDVHKEAKKARKLLGEGAPEHLTEKFEKNQQHARAVLRNNVQESLGAAVQDYLSTYLNYVFTQSTGINPVTLAALDISKCDALKAEVKSLADALSKAKNVEGLADLLIEARTKSQDYAGGLYVDLYEFCDKLSDQLGGSQKEANLQVVQDKCKGVKKELEIPKKGDPPGNSLVLVNGSVHTIEKGDPLILVNHEVIGPGGEKHSRTLTDLQKPRNHGISIYFPYFRVEQEAKVNKPLVKGSQLLHGPKGYGDMLNGAAAEYLMCARRNLILDTESYYRHLQLAKDTGWYEFITKQWTRALIEKVPADLDYHYSAQQSWINSIPAPVHTPTLSPPEQSASQEQELVAKE